MPSFALLDFRLTVGGTNLSTYVTNITLTVEAEALENTAMGGGGWRSRLGGLKDWSVEIEFNQDFAAGAVDDTLWTNYGNTATITGRPTSDVIGTGNPEYSGPALITQTNPFGNAVGELAKASVTWPAAGALARATA